MTESAGPGDGGPCPICGEDMGAKEYEATTIFTNRFTGKSSPSKVSGRYWHMKNEHMILEHYKPLQGKVV